ncbi:penicillin-binding protein 2 [Clostridiaceae bacterium]|nr:penicillin-binding protein 2 [Clostridiaceae bacterium]RKI11660.1 penicillin-binding protein 2 [bacterium 1XD21-70]
MRKERPDPDANKSLLAVTYLMVGLFVGMILYFGYFLQYRGETVINNSYNSRLDRFADRIVRGELLSKDGRVLAMTEEKDGEEKRVYPYGSLFAHGIGYWDHGKTGLEALANFYLLTSHMNLAERTVNELCGVKNIGDNVITTLDVDLQQAASDALGERRGAVIVMEPDTGKVLAMVSKPGFDPNTLGDDWDALIAGENTQAQLLNRASQGLYPPGSTFKVIMALEYIRENPDTWQDFTFDCDGVYEQGEYTISCYHGNVHGHQNLEQAFANSCNGAFAALGLETDAGKVHELAEQLLFNKELPFPLAYSKGSFTMNEGADTWEVLQTSIGQGNTQMTPIHNAMVTAAVANGGVLMKPYLVERVENAAGEEIHRFLPEAYGSLMEAGEADILAGLMRRVVTEGTGSAVRTDAYEVAGKTGSAEFEAGKETHAWFTGFAPAEDPQIVVAVVVEESGSGGQIAAPVARSVFDMYFSK